MAAHGGTRQSGTQDGDSGERKTGTRVFLHIGEPKTGTTFLQQVMWGNRAALAARGVVLPGHHGQDHFRASQDLRGIQKLGSDPAGSWTGEWEILATQARQAAHTAVISHELFAAADAEQAQRAVRSLQPAEVHLVITVRDMATLLPAEWQETVKHRNGRGWEDWLADVIDTESVAGDRRQFWFWRVHDTLAILRQWAEFLPPQRMHVIMVPPAGAGNAVLWERFAGLLAIDPAAADLSCARPNASLGLPEIEFLRRLNQALPDEVPDWFYMWTVKEGVAHRALAARPRSGRLVLPAGRLPWAREQGEILVAGLAASDYDIVGDLDELLPRPAPEAGPAGEALRAGQAGQTGKAGQALRADGALGAGEAPEAAAPRPADQPAEQVLEAAVEAAATLVLNQYRKEYGRPQPQRAAARRPGLAGRVESAVAASPRLKRTVRELSSRHPAVRRLRILAWQALERTRVRSHP